MKKTAIILTIALCVLMAFSLVACNTSGPLSTPKNVNNVENTLFWDEVKNASGYVVVLDGDEKNAVAIKDPSQTYYTYMTNVPGPHKFKVKATGTGNFTDSGFSKELTFINPTRLSSPVLTSVADGTKIKYTWTMPEEEKKFVKDFSIKIGMNLNQVTPKTIPANIFSYEIDMAHENYADYGIYSAKVVANSNNDLYKSSYESNEITFTRSKKINTPKEFKFDTNAKNYTWTFNDKDVTDSKENYRFKLVATNVNDPKADKYETTVYSTSCSLSSLQIDKAGKYEVKVMAYMTDDKSSLIYQDSDFSAEKVEVIKLNPVLNDNTTGALKLEGNILSWPAVEGASSYTVYATTGRNNSFQIKSSDIVDNKVDLSKVSEFKNASYAGRAFTFEVVAKGATDSATRIVIDSERMALDSGAYYQYIPVEADYKDNAERDKVIPKKVTPEKGEAYYPVNNLPQLMWALKNATTENIVLVEDISLADTEFISPATSFKGKFDGQNNILSSIRISDKFKRNNISIFGDVVAGASIENLVISGIDVDITNKSCNNTKNGIIANTNAGTIKNVAVIGNIMVANGGNGAFITYENKGTIDSAVVGGDIQAKNTAGIAVINNQKITNAVVSAKSINGVASIGEVFVGGVAAINNGTIDYSSVDSYVLVNTVKESTLGIAGGVVGRNAGTIKYTYFSNTVEAVCTNLKIETSLLGGFVGENLAGATIQYSYVDSQGSIKRLNTIPVSGGFAGKNAGTITNVYSSIRIPDSSNENKAAFVADNTSGTISNAVFNMGKSKNAPMTLANKEGTLTKVEGLQNNKMNDKTASLDVLGAEFIVYNNFNPTMPVLKNVMYVNVLSPNVDRDIPLKDKINYNAYYLGGEEKKVTNELRTRKSPGYQIIKYVDDATKLVYNRLVLVK